MTLDETMAEMPIVAIIRGVTPSEVVAHVEALYDAGVRIVEIPLNSPDPLESLRRTVEAYGDRMICGSGTVLQVEQVDQVKAAGGHFLVSPDCKPPVIRRAVELGLDPMPGFATSTEMFAATDAGARYLKLFPAGTYGPGHIAGLKAVAPKGAVLMAVGGVTAATVGDWWKAGARGFGIGGELYRPGQTAEVTRAKAGEMVAAVRAVMG